MSKDKKNNNENPIEENNSPIVNVEWKPLDWVEQFQKFIIDLTGVVNDSTYNKN